MPITDHPKMDIYAPRVILNHYIIMTSNSGEFVYPREIANFMSKRTPDIDKSKVIDVIVKLADMDLLFEWRNNNKETQVRVKLG